MIWICKHCGAQMYRVVNADQSAKATCTSCSQYADCAKCSSPSCGLTKCSPCQAKLEAGQIKPPTGTHIQQDEDP